MSISAIYLAEYDYVLKQDTVYAIIFAYRYFRDFGLRENNRLYSN